MLNTVDIQNGQLYCLKSDFLWCCELSKQNYVTHDGKKLLRAPNPVGPLLLCGILSGSSLFCKSTYFGVFRIQKGFRYVKYSRYSGWADVLF